MVSPPCQAGGDIIAGGLIGGDVCNEDMDPGKFGCAECNFEREVDGGCGGK